MIMSDHTADSDYKAAVAQLGGDTSLVSRFFGVIWESGLQARRFFHTPEHYLNVAGELCHPPSDIACAAYMAGMAHDIAYHQIDRKDRRSEDGFVRGFRETIAPIGRLETLENGGVALHFTEEALARPIYQAVNQLFGLMPDEQGTIALHWMQPPANQNEYLSALFAVRTAEVMGIAPKFALAQAAMIEASVPFGQQDRLVKLRERLVSANQLLEEPLTDQALQETIVNAQQTANRDVGDFRKPFEDFIQNSFKLLLENSAGSVDAHNADLIDTVAMVKAMRGMADFLAAAADDPHRCVFHLADGQPHPDEARATENIRQLQAYLNKASRALESLNESYQKLHATAPENWEALCESGLVNTVQLDDWHVSALDFFYMLEGIQIAEKSIPEQTIHIPTSRRSALKNGSMLDGQTTVSQIEGQPYTVKR